MEGYDYLMYSKLSHPLSKESKKMRQMYTGKMGEFIQFDKKN